MMQCCLDAAADLETIYIGDTQLLDRCLVVHYQPEIGY